MSLLLLHLTSVEQLAQGAARAGLPAELARALREDRPYARFGAVLPDLPRCAGLGALAPALPPGFPRWPPHSAQSPFVRLFHERAPVQLGLKLAELVASGALVGEGAGLAVLAGYFAHLCLERTLAPALAERVVQARRRGESAHAARAHVIRVQALLYLRESEGLAPGDAALRERFQVTKSEGLPVRGIGGGIYELVRTASHEVLHAAPSKSQLDGWVRGLYLRGHLLGSALGRAHALPPGRHPEAEALYRGPQGDFALDVDRAHALTFGVLGRLWTYMARASFTPRARQRFLAELPEGGLEVWAAGF
jgi:hypothetical protein